MADRQAVVERMLAEDPGGFWADCAAKTRQIDDWPMIRLLSRKAEASCDTRALLWLVRSWAMPSKTVPDDERPERQAIEAISGSSAGALIQSIVFEQSAEYKPASQIAAWTVLSRVVPAGKLRSLIKSSNGDEASLLVSMLKQCEPAIDVLPPDRVAVARLMRLVTEHDAAQWSAWADWRQANTSAGPGTLSLRHLPVLDYIDPKQQNWSRERWLSHVRARLADRGHVSRGQAADDSIVVTQRPDRFSDHVDRLGVADLLILDQLLDAMGDSRVRRSLFEHAEADRLDNRTEFGGVLGWDDRGDLVYKPYDPILRRHDQAYIASSRCMEAVYLSLAHVHFHAQRYNNAVWAGPGQGDFDFVNTHHATAVVLTFVDQKTLNVDVYWPGNIVIDLGSMTR
ncbi:MAG: hypothetical protein AAF085_00515 [Planctomycetota bacterium]